MICRFAMRNRSTSQARFYETLRVLVERMATLAPIPDALAGAEAELLHLVDADGAVVRWSGKLLYLGDTPPPKAVEQVLAMLLSRSGGGIVAVDDLTLRHPDLKDCASAGSGALLLPLGNASDDVILWFRPELLQIVAWGGNPAEHVAFDPLTGRLTPRASFAAWQETVRGQSAPWTEADLSQVRELRRRPKTSESAEIAHRNMPPGCHGRSWPGHPRRAGA
ncbi:MAG: hypothetical protein ABSC06_38000 [Rhodopila sp.]